MRKHRDSCRTYSYVEGKGWKHYTKGFRRRSITMKRINAAYNFLFSFLSKATSVKTDDEIIKELDKSLESLKGKE